MIAEAFGRTSTDLNISIATNTSTHFYKRRGQTQMRLYDDFGLLVVNLN